MPYGIGDLSRRCRRMEALRGFWTSFRFRSDAPSRVDAVKGSGEGDGFADVVEGADPGDDALDAHAEAGVGDGAVAAQVEIPLEGFKRKLVGLRCGS